MRNSLQRSISSVPSQLWPVARAAFAYEVDYGHAFLFVPVFLALGAGAYFVAPSEPDILPLLLSLAALLIVAAMVRSFTFPYLFCLAAALTVTGSVAAKHETWRADTKMLGAEISTRMTARVVRIEHQSSGRVRLTLDVVATERPQLSYAPDRVRATARQIPDGVTLGDLVVGVVRLMPASGPVRPMSYDFAFQSYFDGIGAVGFFLSGPQIAAESRHPPNLVTRLSGWIEGWRQRTAHRIETTIGGSEGAIAAALITGIRAGIPEEINEALRVTGLYHVISISGLHMALVAGTLMFSVRCGFAFFPALAMRRPIKKYAAAFAIVATALYLIMSGADVAAQRSFLMLAIMLIAVLADRAALTLRNLAISAIVILLVAPHEVVGPSFQMSFAATAALVSAYAYWSERRERRQGTLRSRARAASFFRKLSGYAVGLSMTSIIAGLATALFTAWHFQQVSPLGLFANLAAMPIVSVVVMPMAVLATLLMPFGLDALPLFAMGRGIAGMNAIAFWLAERSMFDATGAISLPGVVIMTGALAVLTMAGSWLRILAAPLAIIAAALILFDDAVPDVLIAEDGQLVAVRLSDGSVAVNRKRPRAFIMDNWKRAFGTEEMVPPAELDLVQTRPQENAIGFMCDNTHCVADQSSGALIVQTNNADTARAFCQAATLIVINDATAQQTCPSGNAQVITKRDLARQGSAAVRLPPSTSSTTPQAPTIEIRFSIAEPYRPWHRHRAFSREARGLAPYQRQEGSGSTAKSDQAPSME